MTTDTDLIRENNQEGLQVGDFKVGDRVRDEADAYWAHPGVKGTVVDTSDGSTEVDLDGLQDRFWFHADVLEYADPEKRDNTPAPDVVANPSGEVRSVSSSGAEKGTKPERYDLLPVEALAKVARHYGMGSTKYADHNWRKGYEWSKSYAALQRHANAFWGGEDIDEESGSPHMAGVAFHALTLLTYMDEQRQFDDRWNGAAA